MTHTFIFYFMMGIVVFIMGWISGATSKSLMDMKYKSIGQLVTEVKDDGTNLVLIEMDNEESLEKLHDPNAAYFLLRNKSR